MLREVQAVEATPRWPAADERFRTGWGDVAAAVPLLEALEARRGDGAIERALADVLEWAACEGPAVLAVLVEDDAAGTRAASRRLRLRCLWPAESVPDLAIPPTAEVVPAVAAALRDRVDARAGVGCPLMGRDGRPCAWLVALGGQACAERLRPILEAVAWVLALALRDGWEGWRTRPDWPGLTPEEQALCRAAREAAAGDVGQAVQAAPGAAGETRTVDDAVQFTVYRPRRIPPETWRPVLAFAHLAERRPDAPVDAPDPLEEVGRQARQILGADVDAYADVTADSGEAIPREGELTFVLDLPGMAVNPAQRSFRWRTQGPSPPSLPMTGDTGRLQASSQDGTLLASMDDAGVLRIESQPPKGEPLVIATAFKPPDVVGMRFSDDGALLLCELRTGETVAWDVRTGVRVAIG
jgi:hypothetical protein